MEQEKNFIANTESIRILAVGYDTPEPDAFTALLAKAIDAEITAIASQSHQKILAKAEEIKADIISVCWVDQPRLNRVTRQVALSSPVSVLVVKPATKALEHLLVCSGGHPVSYPVIAMGAFLAEHTQAKATILHVANALPSMYTGLDAMEETLSDLLERDTMIAHSLRYAAHLFEDHKVLTRIELRHGTPVEEILRSSAKSSYDLIIVGASDAGHPLNRLFMARVTPRIIDRAPCPVFITRAAG